VTVSIVDGFESIHVGHGDGKGALGTRSARHFLPQDREDGSMIPKTRKGIAAGLVAQGLTGLK
jgi:hypothetical protein